MCGSTTLAATGYLPLTLRAQPSPPPPCWCLAGESGGARLRPGARSGCGRAGGACCSSGGRSGCGWCCAAPAPPSTRGRRLSLGTSHQPGARYEPSVSRACRSGGRSAQGWHTVGSTGPQWLMLRSCWMRRPAGSCRGCGKLRGQHCKRSRNSSCLCLRRHLLSSPAHVRWLPKWLAQSPSQCR